MRFELSAVPTAQQRTRHTKTGRAYKSATQEANERTLEALLLPYKPKMPLRGPVRLDFTACMPNPYVSVKTSKRGHAERKNRAYRET